MGVTNANKQINVQQIDCNGTLQVTLALAAAPDITENPTDMVLLLDRSGSMAGVPLENLKLGANAFIDIIDQATDGSKDGHIGGGSRIGIVSFSDTATTDAPLSTSVDLLKSKVDALVQGGATNHGDAFSKGVQLFDPASSNARVLILFTDGKTTAGPPPAPIAAAAKAAGIIIYCIGLLGSSGLNESALDDWASDPDASYVAIAPDAADLEALFANLALNIAKTGATNIVIEEELDPAFAILHVDAPDQGTAMIQDTNTLKWTIPALGVSGSEGATLQFLVQHVGPDAGLLQVNRSISYQDTEGNQVSFPDPYVTVDCGINVQPEPCPQPVDVTIKGCEDSAVVDLGNVYLESQGRILQLDVTVKDVCPGQRVALGVILTEADPSGVEYQRGFKAFTIPAHQAPACRDVLVRCIRFVLPEDLNVSGGNGRAICGPRNLKVRFLANTIDTDYRCCPPTTIF